MSKIDLEPKVLSEGDLEKVSGAGNRKARRAARRAAREAARTEMPSQEQVATRVTTTAPERTISIDDRLADFKDQL